MVLTKTAEEIIQGKAVDFVKRHGKNCTEKLIRRHADKYFSTEGAEIFTRQALEARLVNTL